MSRMVDVHMRGHLAGLIEIHVPIVAFLGYPAPARSSSVPIGWVWRCPCWKRHRPVRRRRTRGCLPESVAVRRWQWRRFHTAVAMPSEQQLLAETPAGTLARSVRREIRADHPRLCCQGVQCRRRSSPPHRTGCGADGCGDRAILPRLQGRIGKVLQALRRMRAQQEAGARPSKQTVRWIIASTSA